MSASGVGVGVGSFAHGLSEVLLANRHEEEQTAREEESRKAQAQMALLPFVVQHAVNTGDVQSLIDHIGVKPKKGGPDHGEILKSIIAPNAAVGATAPMDADQTAAATKSATDTGTLPNFAPTPAAPAKPRQTVLGVPMLSDEEVEQRDATTRVDTVRRAWEALKKTDPNATLADAADLVDHRQFLRPYGSASEFQSIPGQLPDGTLAYGVFDRQSGKYLDPNSRRPLEGFQPRTSSASFTLGADRESISKELYNARATALTGPQMAHVNAVLLQRTGQLKPSQAITSANAMLPNGTAAERLQLADDLMSGVASRLANTTPAGAQTEPTSATVTPTAPTSATEPTSPPKKTGLGADLSPDLAGTTKATGAPLAPAIVSVIAKANQTNDLIDSALQALAPFKNDNSLNGSLKLAKSYRSGVYDPITSAATQLADLAGLQASASQALTSGGTRAYQFYIDRRQHVPKLPSFRQVTANRVLSGKTIQTASGLVKGDEGTFDTPKAMYEKLLRAKANNLAFVREVQSGTAVGRGSRSSSSPTQVAAPSLSAPSTAIKDDNGNWVIRTATPAQ